MRNKPVFILIFFLTAAYTWSQSSVFDYPLSTQNLENYNALCAQLSSRPFTKGVFDQTRALKRQNRSLVSSGDFIVAADLGVVWITKSPVPSITTLGKDYMIQSVPGGIETKIDAKSSEIYLNMADTIGSLFTGNAEKLKSNFDNFYTETQSADGKVWALGLVPRERAFRNYAGQIILEGFIRGQTAVIGSISIHERNGDSLTYVFSEQIYPSRLEAHEQAYFSAD